MTRARRKLGPEAALKRAVLDALALVPGVRALRMQAGKLVIGTRENGDRRMVDLGETGTPDVLVMLPDSRCVWLELKAAKGRITDAQHAWHDAARKLGHAVHVVRDVADALRVVREAKEQRA